MNETSASRAETPAVGAAPEVPILVWDAPVRVFHWLMVLSFAGAYLSAESERWRLLHVTLGYTMVGLVGFRIVWGLLGTRYARFVNFVRGPAVVWRYARALLRGQPEHYTGHNPLGALAILALLSLTLAVGASGWAVFNDVGGSWLEEVHEVLSNLMLGVIGIHVAGVLVASRIHRENLVRSMFTGRKRGRLQDGVRSAWLSVAALILLATMGWGWFEWQGAPMSSSTAEGSSVPAKSKGDEIDRD